jgi:hypothetical protein
LFGTKTKSTSTSKIRWRNGACEVSHLKGEGPDAAQTAIEPQDDEHVGTPLDPSLTPSPVLRLRQRRALHAPLFTNLDVKTLPPPAKNNKIYYDGPPGFGIRVSANGVRAFILNYTVRGTGRERRFTIGHFPNWRIEAARARAKELKRLVDTGGDPLADIEAKRHASPDTPRPNIGRRIAEDWLWFAERGTKPTCFLYRHYDATGELLYVGMTLNILSRQKDHLITAEWANSIFQIIIEPFANREELIEAEAVAIKTEYPK